jgi:hypothetical protein
LWDSLNGGGGKDKFRAEWVMLGATLINIDVASDFDPALDSVY